MYFERTSWYISFHVPNISVASGKIRSNGASKKLCVLECLRHGGRVLDVIRSGTVSIEFFRSRLSTSILTRDTSTDVGQFISIMVQRIDYFLSRVL